MRRYFHCAYSVPVCNMASCRPNDERLAYKQAVLESNGPGSYMLQAPRVCNASYVMDPRISSQGHLASVCGDKPLVDVDSELLGITRRIGSCPEASYQPGSVPFCKLVHVPDDDTREAAFAAEDCRLSNPPCTLRGTGINRWQWLCSDPQDTALEPYTRFGVNYRTVVKDNHRIERIKEPCNPPAVRAHELMSQAFVPKDHVWSGFTTVGLPERPVHVHWRSACEIEKL